MLRWSVRRMGIPHRFEDFSHSDKMAQPIDMTMQKLQKNCILKDFWGLKYPIQIPA